MWIPNQNPGIHVEYVNISMNLIIRCMNIIRNLPESTTNLDESRNPPRIQVDSESRTSNLGVTDPSAAAVTCTTQCTGIYGNKTELQLSIRKISTTVYGEIRYCTLRRQRRTEARIKKTVVNKYSDHTEVS